MRFLVEDQGKVMGHLVSSNYYQIVMMKRYIRLTAS